MRDGETREGRLKTIEEVEECHGFRHPDDFRAWLEAVPPSLSRLDWTAPEIAEIDEDMWGLDTIQLVTAKFLPFFLDHQDELYFWHAALLKTAVIVGCREGSAEWLVQINGGTHHGEIYETDHERYHGRLQGLIQEGAARDALIEDYGDLGHLDPDERYELLFDPNVAALHEHLIATSFDDLAAAVLIARGAELPTQVIRRKL